MISTSLASALLAAWIISLLVGVSVIRDARPYSDSWTGKGVTFLGAVVLVVALVALGLLTKAMVP